MHAARATHPRHARHAPDRTAGIEGPLRNGGCHTATAETGAAPRQACARESIVGLQVRRVVIHTQPADLLADARESIDRLRIRPIKSVVETSMKIIGPIMETIVEAVPVVVVIDMAVAE